MINRSFLPWLFAFLLAFSQQMVLTHPYEHTFKHTYKHTQNWQQKNLSHKNILPKNTLPSAETCGKCIALAGVGSVVASKSLVLHFLATQFKITAAVQQPVVSAHFQAYHSRAPPYLA